MPFSAFNLLLQPISGKFPRHRFPLFTPDCLVECYNCILQPNQTRTCSLHRDVSNFYFTTESISARFELAKFALEGQESGTFLNVTRIP